MEIKHPQTKASYLAAHANKLQAIASYGCLAMCYLFCAGIDGDEADYIINVCKAMDDELIGSDCYVADAEKFIKYFTGKRVNIVKKLVDANSIADISAPAPVRYDYQGKCHWVVVENGSIVFNSLVNSICVTRGKPTTARIIKWP